MFNSHKNKVFLFEVVQDFLMFLMQLKATRKILEEYASFGAITRCSATLTSTQVRNGSTLVGNIMLNDYHSDLLPLLIGANDNVLVVPKGKKKTSSLITFVVGKGKRNVDVKKGEVILSIKVPPSSANGYTIPYKMSKRDKKWV